MSETQSTELQTARRSDHSQPTKQYNLADCSIKQREISRHGDGQNQAPQRRKLDALAFVGRSPDRLGMRVCFTKCLLSCFALASLLLALSSCGSKQTVDWRNRDVAWKFGPTTGAARSEHLTATGKKGSKPLAEGWNCRLIDGKNLRVKPYKLAKSHPLLGKTIMRIGLFNKASERIGTVTSDVITADNASFTFEITQEQAKPLWDLIIWFRKP